MKNEIKKILQNSFDIAMEQQKLEDWSDDAPNLLFDRLSESCMCEVEQTLRDFAEAHNVNIVLFDEYDIDVMRVQSRTLYQEINEAPTPSILLIRNYGMAYSEAREFVRSVVKNKLYPITNLWQQTVLDRLLFTVALSDKEQYWHRNVCIGESSCFALYDEEDLLALKRLPLLYTDKQQEEVEAFIEESFGGGDGYIAHEMTSEYVHTDTAIIARRGEETHFVTFGMGARCMQAPAEEPSRIELVMHGSPLLQDKERQTIAASELVRLSKYPFENDTWFGHGHTIEASDLFRRTFGYDAFLFADGDHWVELSDIGEVGFLTVVPIYREEREWAMENSSLIYYAVLQEKCGEGAAQIDVARPVCLPDEEDVEQVENATFCRMFGITPEEMKELRKYLMELQARGEEVTYDGIAAWVDRLPRA
ncbi:MAG: hypothetical protein E7624_02720 [Ruminococcaceae bacterium]|nr:hypothetical protein [Oscillospiraceae bacterium]